MMNTKHATPYTALSYSFDNATILMSSKNKEYMVTRFMRTIVNQWFNGAYIFFLQVGVLLFLLYSYFELSSTKLFPDLRKVSFID